MIKLCPACYSWVFTMQNSLDVIWNKWPDISYTRNTWPTLHCGELGGVRWTLVLAYTLHYRIKYSIFSLRFSWAFTPIRSINISNEKSIDVHRISHSALALDMHSINTLSCWGFAGRDDINKVNYLIIGTKFGIWFVLRCSNWPPVIQI